MGHEEEDKELMMIRMETLKTMIGKLKNKSSQKISKDTKPIVINKKEESKASVKGRQSADISRPTSLAGSSPPQLNCIKSPIKSKSTPTSPSPLSIRNNATSSSPQPKNKSQPNVLYRSPITSPLSLNQATTPVVNFKAEANPMSSHVYQSRYKLSYHSVPNVNSPVHVNANLSNNKPQFATVANSTVYTSSYSLHTHLHLSKSLSSKSYSDSEISTRKTLKVSPSSVSPYSIINPVFTSPDSFSTLPSRQTSKLSSNTGTFSTSSTVPLYAPVASSNLLKNNHVSGSSTVTKPLTKVVKRPETHTITKPVIKKVTSTTTNTRLSSTKDTSTISNNSTVEKSNTPKPGKILFERTGKILFDRHANQQKISNSNPKGPFSLNMKQNFDQEFNLIRERCTSGHKTNAHRATTRTKFYASNYIPPETSEKARTILSKYKVVRTKNNPKKDINANYPLSSSGVSSSSTLPTKNKILYERPKLVYGSGNAIGSYRGAYSKKGRVYCPTGKISTNQYQNFVSRRLKYIKSVDSDPFVKQSSDQKNENKKEIILSRHGSNYQLAGNLKSLRRLSSNQGQQLKHTSPGSKNVSAKQYVANQVLKKTLSLTARKKVNKEKEYCLFYNRFGRCKRGKECHFIHDPEKIAICTRFLRGTCKDDTCLFSHKLDPDKMPVCSYFLRGECARDDCPYRHVNVGESASICEDFLKGYCPKGKECDKKHILDCEEYSKTGSCSKGRSCILAHRQDNRRKRKYSGSRPPKGFRQKRKKIGGQEKDEAESSHPNEGKRHTLPKFISEKIKMLRESTTQRPTSFADIKKFYESAKTDDDSSIDKTSDLWGSDFIPLSHDSGGESEDESTEFHQKMFSFKK